MVLEIRWWPQHSGDLGSIPGSATDQPNNSRQTTSTHLPNFTEQVWDSHSPIPPPAVPSQPLHPTDLQYSHGLSSASWSLIQATVYQPPPDVPSCCVWGMGPQSRREGTALPDIFAKSTYLSSLSMSQDSMCPGRLPLWDATHGLLSPVRTQGSPIYISQRYRKSRSPLPFLGLYFSFYHFHWHEKSLGTRITFSMVCTAQRGSRSPEDLKSFCAFMTRFIFLPSRPFLHKTISVITEIHHEWSCFPWFALIICWMTSGKYFTVLGLCIFKMQIHQ